MHTGEVPLSLLLDAGADTVFGLPDGQTLALYDAIASNPARVRHILLRDEQSGPYAAVGYARVTGRVGICDATVGPGATKLTSGLAEAYNASVPLLAIVSDHPTNWLHLIDRGAASQGIDQLRMLWPLIAL